MGSVDGFPHGQLDGPDDGFPHGLVDAEEEAKAKARLGQAKGPGDGKTGQTDELGMFKNGAEKGFTAQGVLGSRFTRWHPKKTREAATSLKSR